MGVLDASTGSNEKSAIWSLSRNPLIIKPLPKQLSTEVVNVQMTSHCHADLRCSPGWR
jgi:hypothetical protein